MSLVFLSFFQFWKKSLTYSILLNLSSDSFILSTYPNFTYFLPFLLLLILSFFLLIPTFFLFFHSSFSLFSHSFYLSQLFLFSSIPPCPDSFILSTYPNFTKFLPFLLLLILSFFLLIPTLLNFFHFSFSWFFHSFYLFPTLLIFFHSSFSWFFHFFYLSQLY